MTTRLYPKKPPKKPLSKFPVWCVTCPFQFPRYSPNFTIFFWQFLCCRDPLSLTLGLFNFFVSFSQILQCIPTTLTQIRILKIKNTQCIWKIPWISFFLPFFFCFRLSSFFRLFLLHPENINYQNYPTTPMHI